MTRTLDVVIAGGGRVGQETAAVLSDRDERITIVEQDGDTVDAIADEWMATVIKGDATDPNILEQAGVADADVLAALTGNRGVNLAICLVGTDIAPAIRTVARVDSASGTAYERFVDEVVYPERTGARAAATSIVGSDVRTLADVTGDIQVMEIRVSEGAPAAGRTLSEMRFPAGALVISDDEGGRIAQPETTLDPGTQYLVAAESGVVNEVMDLLRG